MSIYYPNGILGDDILIIKDGAYPNILKLKGETFMKKWLFFIVASVMLVALTACGSDDASTDDPSESGDTSTEAPAETITWRLGHLSNEEHVWHKTAEKFAELVNDKTNGQLEIEIFPNEQLGPEMEMLDGIRAGTVDMTISGESMQNWAPKAALLGIPYAIQSEEHMVRVVEGEIGADIEAEIIEKVGVTPLYYHMRAPRNLTSNRPINHPDDLDGFRMRVPNVPLFMSVWEAAGARPQVMAFSEVFTGLQQGVLEGQENPVDLIHSAGFYEVQEYVNVTEHSYSWIYVVVGNEQLNSLSEELKNAVLEAAAEAQAYGQELFEEETSNYEQRLKDEGMIFNTDVDQQAFATIMQPAIEEFLDDEQLEIYRKMLDSAD